ncbi:MAG: hypothetical protein NWE89_01890 [Candidatus Bathyarchaeota archaeon]|nr:hypothetical protein [Candidatus Bathyarchaeota archaeon]
MGKLVFINKVTWTKDFLKNSDAWQPEMDRWDKLAKKHGLKLMGRGTPWGNNYHNVTMYVTDKGLDAWNSFTTDILGNGTPDAWKYVKEFATDIVSLA